MIELFIFIKAVLGWIGWLGIGLIPALACAAVIFFFPPFRNIAILVGAGWLLAFTAYTLGDSNGDSRGANRVREEWAAAVQLAGQQAADARESAEQETEHLEPEPEPPVVAPVTPPGACHPAPVCRGAPRARNDGVLRGDPFNRDSWRR